MNLDSDATLEYVLKTGSLHLTEEQLATPSGYNTHTNSGLPIGPVSNPGDTANQGCTLSQLGIHCG